MRRFIWVGVVCLLCALVSKAEADVAVFGFFANRSEREVLDSVSHHCGASVVPIRIEDGNISEAVKKFGGMVDSVRGRNANAGYSIVGVGVLGSAAATICASEFAPQSLVLVSGAGIDGKDLLYRFSGSFSFIVDMPYAMADSLRGEILAGLEGRRPLFMVPEEFRQLSAYRPAPYLQKIKCPVYSAFGTSDCVVEWYSNAVGVEANLRGSEGNVVRVYPGLGYCLREGAEPINIPMPGDKKAGAVGPVSADAIADIVGWLEGRRP